MNKSTCIEFPTGINKKYLNNDCYELDTNTGKLTITLEGDYEKFPVKRASDLIDRFGIEKIITTEKISSILVFVSIILFFSPIFTGFFLKDISFIISIFSIFSFLISSSISERLLEIENYYNISKCNRCGIELAYEEIKKPLLKQISTYDYYEEIETRYMKCQYCKNEEFKTNSYKISNSRKRREYKKGKACKVCGEQSTLLEYRSFDADSGSHYLLKIIKYSKCTTCGNIQVTIQDVALYKG